MQFYSQILKSRILSYIHKVFPSTSFDYRIKKWIQKDFPLTEIHSTKVDAVFDYKLQFYIGSDNFTIDVYNRVFLVSINDVQYVNMSYVDKKKKKRFIKVVSESIKSYNEKVHLIDINEEDLKFIFSDCLDLGCHSFSWEKNTISFKLGWKETFPKDDLLIRSQFYVALDKAIAQIKSLYDIEVSFDPDKFTTEGVKIYLRSSTSP